MAAKAKKHSSAKKPAPAPVRSNAPKKDAKALNKEIGEALFTDEERLELFFAKHWKKLLAAALIAVVAITAAFAVHKHAEAAKKADSAKLAQAKSIAEIEAAIAAAPKARGVDAARFRLAKLYTDDKKFDQARKVLAAISAGSEDPAARDRASLNSAYLLELEGKTADAAQSFAVIVGAASASAAARAEAAYSAGRLYVQLKQPAEAKKVLARLQTIKATPEQPVVGEWKNRAAELEQSIN